MVLAGQCDATQELRLLGEADGLARPRRPSSRPAGAVRLDVVDECVQDSGPARRPGSVSPRAVVEGVAGIGDGPGELGERRDRHVGDVRLVGGVLHRERLVALYPAAGDVRPALRDHVLTTSPPTVRDRNVVLLKHRTGSSQGPGPVLSGSRQLAVDDGAAEVRRRVAGDADVRAPPAGGRRPGPRAAGSTRASAGRRACGRSRGRRRPRAPGAPPGRVAVDAAVLHERVRLADGTEAEQLEPEPDERREPVVHLRQVDVGGPDARRAPTAGGPSRRRRHDVVERPVRGQPPGRWGARWRSRHVHRVVRQVPRRARPR